MVPTIEKAIRRLGWIPEEELPDMVALSQSAPGLLTVNMSIFTGHRIRGLAGSIAATAGVILAPIIAILLIAMFFASFRDIPVVKNMFYGVRPVAVAIIAGYTVRQLKKNAHWWQWVISVCSLAALAVFKLSAVYVLLAVILGSAAISLFKHRRDAR